jgi:DNA mismatch endonuclease, patch repair protein
MADTVSRARRSEIMALIRGEDTQPELRVRRFLHRVGLRYRLHVRGLAGRPDIVFASRRTCVFVHGCFWHGCRRCVDGTRSVKSNANYWSGKVKGNKARDARNVAELRRAGWQVLTMWECETEKEERLARLAERILAAKTR